MNRILTLLALSCAPALASPINEQIDLPDGNEVLIENTCGEITVAGLERDGVVVRGELGDDAELNVSRSGKRVSVRVKGDGEGFFSGWSEDACATLRVEVPVHTELSIEAVSAEIEIGGVHSEISVEVVSGDIWIGEGPSSVDIESVSSDVTLKGVTRELEVELVSGDVTVENAHGRVDFTSVSGDLNLSGAGLSRVQAESVSGDIRIVGGLESGARLDLTCHSGDVDMVLPKGTSGAFEVQSFSGGIDLMGVKPKSREYGPGASLNHAIGEGSAEISITTFSGNVEIKEQ